MIKRGFSQVEILIVISLLMILFSLGTVVLSNFARQDQVLIDVKKIESLIIEAKIKTINGFVSNPGEASSFGLYFENNRYLLFPGESYDPGNLKNQAFILPSSLEIETISLPSNSLVFEKITGEVKDFDPVQNFLILSDRQSSLKKKISVNKLGVVTVENQ